MPAPRQSVIPPKIVRIDSKKYLVRTLGVDDASDRWASWMSDPEAMHMLKPDARKQMPLQDMTLHGNPPRIRPI
jgi:hypothetical protein